MDVTFIVAVSILLLFISLILVTAINYFVRIPESATIIELRNKVKHLFDVFFGSRGVATGERVTTDLYRIPLILEEMNGTARTNEVIGVGIEYDDACNKKTSWNNTVRVYDQQFNELPSKISYQEFCSSQWLNNSIVTFVVNMAANEKKRVYVYSINNTNTTAPSHNITNITNLVAYWNFDEISGTLVKDVSTNENNGTQNGGIDCSISGRFGTACSFDGVNDYIRVNDSGVLQFGTGSFTLMAWIKRNTSSTSQNHVIINKKTNGTTDCVNDIYFAVQSNNKLRGWTAGTGCGDASSIDSSATIGTAWTHVAFVRESNGNLSLFINGTLDTESTLAIKNMTSDKYLRIGAGVIPQNDSVLSTYLFNGTIDDVRIYNRALNESEISISASDIPTVTAFPAQSVTAISAAKIQELTGRNYQEIKALLGGDFDFRIEISEK